LSAEDGILTVDGEATCAEVEARARPWLFSSDRPDVSVREWIDRGGGDLLWGLLGPTRAQVLGVTVELPDGRRTTFGGRVVKNVAGYDLARTFVGARGELGRVLQAHLRVRPAPRGWRAAVRRGTERAEALAGPGCAVWTGDTWRFLRRGEPTPGGYEELDPFAARDELRGTWRDVRHVVPLADETVHGVVLAGPRMVGVRTEPPARTDALWSRLKEAWR
jgi:FAD/FMN-containing dehydrogenase